MVATSAPRLHSMRQSSFYWPMQLLSSKRRHTLKIVYLFCKTVDDIADGDASYEEKKQQLDGWRAALDQPALLPAELQTAIRDYDLPPSLFRDILDGMKMDIDHQPIPVLDTLERYCYCVAGAVGLLLIRILGCEHPDSQAFAKQIGQCLQRINILRDVMEDAERERIYLPREWLPETNLSAHDILRHSKSIQPTCHRMADDIHARFASANQHIHASDRWQLLPALCMASIYMSWLEVMQRDGFSYSRVYRLSLWQKLLAMGRGLRWTMQGRINARSIGAPAQ